MIIKIQVISGEDQNLAELHLVNTAVTTVLIIISINIFMIFCSSVRPLT